MTFKKFLLVPDIIRLRRNSLSDLLIRNKRKLAETRIDEIVNEQSRFPYFNRYFELTMAKMYRYNILRKRVKLGDEYDLQQLFYLLVTDTFITNDKAIKEISDLVFNKPTTVLSVKNLMELI